MLVDGVLLSFLHDYWLLIVVAGLAVHLLRNKFHNGLNKFPAAHPLAAYTNWWRFFDVYNRSAERTHIELHRKHGDIVRLGPNALSFADPKAIKTIYGLNKGMTKSDFYPVQQAVAGGQRLESLFSTQDESYHAKYRRCINSAFSMSSLVEYEPLVDSTMNVFIEQTKQRYCDTGRSCNFSRWLQFYAFDVIGELTWSKRLGFIERDEDVDGIVSFVSGFLAYCAPVGQQPKIDLLWEKNPIRLLLQKYGISKTIFPVTKFALAQSSSRESEMSKIRSHGMTTSSSKNGIDLLTKFTLAQHAHPTFMTDKQVLASCTSMIFAGSETTAISLSSIFVHLLRHPSAYAKLMAELDAASLSGLITSRENNTVTWAESQQLPYLDAVIQESFRLHPAPGLILERVVPASGMSILDTHVPGGTIVGCNAWVLHRRSEVFGEDVDTFRPERWIEASPDALREMKATMFQFGGGARTCIGKNISLLEMYKLVPTVLRNFVVELDEEEGKGMRTKNAWFVGIDFHARFKPREMIVA
jgi:cytochrome P450